VGYLVKNSKKINGCINKVSTKIYLILPLFVINYFLCFTNDVIDMRNLKYYNYFVFYACLIIGSLSYMLLFNYLGKFEFFNRSKMKNILLYLGRNTLILLVLNEIVISIYINRISMMQNSILIKGISMAFIVIVTFIPIIDIINNYLPFTLLKLNKSKYILNN